MSVRFGCTFKLCTKALVMLRAHPAVPFSVTWIPLLLIRYGSIGFVFSSLIYSSFHEDFNKKCINMSILIVCMSICFHHMTMLRYKKKFNELMEKIDNDLLRSETLCPEEKSFVKEYIKEGINISIMWYMVCVLTVVLFLVGPFSSTLYSMFNGNLKVGHIIDATYPECIEEIKNRIDISIAISGMQIICLTSAIISYTGLYSMVTIFTLHACSQVKIVVRQLGELFAEEQMDNVIIKAKIKDIVRQVQEIYRFVEQLQQSQTFLFELCLKTSTICIPFTCIGAIQAYEQGNANFGQIGLVCGFLLQCYIPCYYCDRLQQKGEELQLAVYSCGWERHWEKTVRSSMLLLVMCTSRPLALRAVFSSVSLYSFKDVCHQAYSIFNIMYAARA